MNRLIWQKETEKCKSLSIALDESLGINIKKFYLIIKNTENFKKHSIYLIPLILDAELYGKSVVRIIKNYFELERNQHIKEEKDTYYWLIDNLGRVEKAIKKSRDGCIGKVEFNVEYGSDKPVNIIKIREYKNLLIEYVNHLAIFPLKRAIEKFENYDAFDKDNKSIIKDKDYFWYLVFLEFAHSCEVLGSITGEESGRMPRNIGRVNLQPTRTSHHPPSQFSGESNNESENQYNVEEGGELSELEEKSFEEEDEI